MEWNAQLYRQQHAFVFGYGEAVVELLTPQPGERILDLGCGTGELTAHIAAAGAEVVGIDLSPAMIGSARAAHPGLRFEVADAADFRFDQPFDAIFSNAALHWVRDAEGAAACMSRALRSGGRLVIEMGGHGNIAALRAGIAAAVRAVVGIEPDHGRHYPSIGEYTALLERHGIETTAAWLFERPTPLAGGERGLRLWIEQFEQAVLKDFDAAQREAIIALAEDKLRASLLQDGQWVADYKRLRLIARKA